MSVFELSRWYALVEAVNVISDECIERGKNFNKIKLPPLVLERYVESTSDIFAKKIIAEFADSKTEIQRTLLPNITHEGVFA